MSSALSKRGVCCLPPRPGLDVGEVLAEFLGPENDWDSPVDPFQLAEYQVCKMFTSNDYFPNQFKSRIFSFMFSMIIFFKSYMFINYLMAK